MASNNFENKIKNSLEERRLQPSPASWDKLQSQLETPQKKRNSKRYWVMAIAASFIGILLFSTLFFNTDTTPDLPIVDTEPATDTIIVVAADVIEIEESIIEPEIEEFQELEVVKSPSNSSNHAVVSQNKEPKSKKSPNNNASKSQVAEVQNTIARILQDSVSEFDSKTGLAEQEPISTEDYIEDLLLQAEQDIIADKSIQQAQQTVNSEQLLEHVENDIEYSFREKVFDAVKTGFVKVKTAVVERNN
ncbi:hypothetical protein [Formosa sp. PL04]|uniref:hypothetical protein n=1 Tax=Formosa sp. PL04 TaxID=3081755 RepID=UPI002980EEA3|nr:hypothetical protein [Formosa sp. PL04]MDW5287477.1 hypothetical protein [Formosa sp. PL04]